MLIWKKSRRHKLTSFYFAFCPKCFFLTNIYIYKYILEIIMLTRCRAIWFNLIVIEGDETYEEEINTIE